MSLNVATQSQPTQVPMSADVTMIAVCLKEIKVTGLKKVPDIFILVTVDDGKKPEWTSSRVKNQPDPLWTDLNIVIPVQPSSTFRIEVLRKSSLKVANHFMGSLTKHIADLVENVTSHELRDKSGKVTGGEVTVKMAIDFSSTNDSQLKVAESKMKIADSSLQHLGTSKDGSSPFSALSDRLEQGLTIVQGAESTYHTLSNVGAFEPVLQVLDSAVKIIDDLATIHPACKAAWILLSAAYKGLRQQVQQDGTVQGLAVSLHDLLIIAKECHTLKSLAGDTDVIQDIAHAVANGASLIDEYMKFNFFGRAAHSIFAPLNTRIENCKDNCLYLKDKLHSTLAIRTNQTVQALSQRALLDKLPIASHAEYDRGKRCLDGTRVQILSDIKDWVENSQKDQPSVFWLYGMGGEGKSTIAATVAQLIEDDYKCLGASFFFAHDDAASQRDCPDIVFSSIAYSLATFNDTIADNICRAVEKKPGIGQSAVLNQFHALLKVPLEEAERKSALKDTLIFIVLDALDECGNEKSRVDLLVAIKQLPLLSPAIRLFITSRDIPDISSAFGSMGPAARAYSLSEIPKDLTKSDIMKFIQEYIEERAENFIDSCSNGWPGGEVLQALTENSASLFIWASTAVKFIMDPEVGDPQGQLDVVLSTGTSASDSPQAVLDALYLSVLKQAYTEKASKHLLQKFKQVIGAIVAVKAPLSPKTIGHLLYFDGAKIMDNSTKVVLGSIQKLHSVVTVAALDQPIHVIHPSFFDFITTKNRSTERFHIDLLISNTQLAKQCLLVMLKYLKQDICQIKDFTKMNYEIGDLQRQLAEHVPDVLRYACTFWAEHLSKSSNNDDDVLQLVEAFFNQCLLYWFEVLSLLNALGSSVAALKLTRDWITTSKAHDGLRVLVIEAYHFALEFQAPMSISAMHTYVSAMAYTPQESILHTIYREKYDRNLHVLTGTPKRWSQCLGTLEGHTSAVSFVAYTPDGTKMVSASDDMTLRIWDSTTSLLIGEPLRGSIHPLTSVAISPDGTKVAAIAYRTIWIWNTTGGLVCQPFEGHTMYITSVTFSTDGSKIISASLDGTIQIWNSTTGTSMYKPLEGHTGAINSIVCFPDGIKLVSGSQDTNLQIWDLRTGTTIGEPLCGHKAEVTIVRPSPDGTKIISGSRNGVLQIWDSTSGASVGKPLEGHTRSITSALFTPDGSRVVSASDDATLCIWNATTGEMICGPLQGHSGLIMTMSISSDGALIVSGSYDNTLRIWNSTTGALIGEPLQGHADVVTSVSFSPDGKIILSGSRDSTMRIWDVAMDSVTADTSDASSTAFIRQPSKGLTYQISSITFSLDGSKVVSGSYDKKIHVWNAKTGTLLGKPLEGHTHWVLSVAFSPDGAKIVSGSWDNTVRIWDSATGILLGKPLKGHQKAVMSVNYSYDGMKIISGSRDKTLKIWDSNTGAPIGKPIGPHTAAVSLAVFSPDGTKLASSSMDNALWLWDSTTGALISGPLENHAIQISSVLFSPDETKIMSWSNNNTFKIWDIITGALISSSYKECSWISPLQYLYVDEHGWVNTPDQKKLWWMPSGNRPGKYSVQAGFVAVGSQNGNVTITDASSLLHTIQV